MSDAWQNIVNAMKHLRRHAPWLLVRGILNEQLSAECWRRYLADADDNDFRPLTEQFALPALHRNDPLELLCIDNKSAQMSYANLNILDKQFGKGQLVECSGYHFMITITWPWYIDRERAFQNAIAYSMDNRDLNTSCLILHALDMLQYKSYAALMKEVVCRLYLDCAENLLCNGASFSSYVNAAKFIALAKTRASDVLADLRLVNQLARLCKEAGTKEVDPAFLVSSA